jgi:hypothetical protein
VTSCRVEDHQRTTRAIRCPNRLQRTMLLPLDARTL